MHDKFCNCLGNESECEPLSTTDPICVHCECPFIERVRADEREKVVAVAQSRADDLHSCHRDDDCELKAQGIDLAISDIMYVTTPAAVRGEGGV